MKSLLVLVFALLVLAPLNAFGQQLPSTFAYSKEPNGEGSFNYILKPDVEGIMRKFGDSSPYQLLGAVVRLDTQRAVIIFVNGQKTAQLSKQKNRSVTITADDHKIKDFNYELAAESEGETLIKLEIGNALMDYRDFAKMMRAGAVLVKFGEVAYRLDRDNLDALRFLAAEIEKDAKKSK